MRAKIKKLKKYLKHHAYHDPSYFIDVILVVGSVLSLWAAMVFAAVVIVDVKIGLELPLLELGLSGFWKFLNAFPTIALLLAAANVVLSVRFGHAIVTRQYTLHKRSIRDVRTKLAFFAAILLSGVVLSFVTTFDNQVLESDTLSGLRTFENLKENDLVIGTVVDLVGVDTILVRDKNNQIVAIDLSASDTKPTEDLKNGDFVATVADGTSETIEERTETSTSNPVVVNPPFIEDPSPPASNPSPSPSPSPDPDPSSPIAITLNNTNTGPKSGTNYMVVSTLVIDEPKVYSGYQASHVKVMASGKGATLRDSRVISTGTPYAIDTTGGWTHGFTNATDFKIERVYVKQIGSGKGILGGGFTMTRSRIEGGEDGVHLNSQAHTIIKESIIEEVTYPSGSHSDAIQLTSGGAGGSLTVTDSILQVGYKMQNAPLQINVISGPIVSKRNWYHGGVYHIHGDPQSYPITSTDDMFAYDTAQFGYNSKATLVRPVWWSRQVRPRTSSPWATPSGEAAGFPGNGTPVTASNSPY